MNKVKIKRETSIEQSKFLSCVMSDLEIISRIVVDLEYVLSEWVPSNCSKWTRHVIQSSSNWTRIDDFSLPCFRSEHLAVGRPEEASSDWKNEGLDGWNWNVKWWMAFKFSTTAFRRTPTQSMRIRSKRSAPCRGPDEDCLRNKVPWSAGGRVQTLRDESSGLRLRKIPT